MRNQDWNKILTGLLLAPIPMVARAEVYLTEEKAAAVLFPNVPMKPGWMDLTAGQVKQIEKASKDRMQSPRVRVFWGPQKEALLIDQVLGKHEFITYAVAINSDGTVKGIEILDYRETYGYQVRDKSWRDRFLGKTMHDPVKVDQDIPNISGATLSSMHITNGVRRMLQTYEILKTKA